MPLSIATILQQAQAKLLAAGFSDTPRLDAEILLAHLLDKNRSFFIAFADDVVSADIEQRFSRMLEQAASGKPIAYITGVKEFWSLALNVSEATLIPRPDTETLVEAVLECYPNRLEEKTVIDLGTGSGAIALALKKERSNWRVLACDQSDAALAVAKKNAEKHRLDVEFRHSDWLQAFSDVQTDKKADIIVSNPPYIEKNDAHLQALRFEPITALVAEDNGMADFKIIIAEAKKHLNRGGSLWLEHGFQQASAVQQLFIDNGFTEVETIKDLSGNNRVSKGVYDE
jgi:release factor glutamine methyltransferase